MSAVIEEWTDNAIEAIQAEYPAWTVQPYEGSLPVESGDAPLVKVAIEGGEIDQSRDRMTGDTYVNATVVCYLIMPRTGLRSYMRAQTASWGLLAFMRLQPFHDHADALMPVGVQFIPEENNGQPVIHRMVWAVQGEVTLILDSEVADADAYDWTEVGQPIRGVDIEVSADG